jgi:hypothetical protein
MNFEIILTDLFKKEAKKLAKKYPSLKSELEQLQQTLTTHPTSGTSLGHDVYKIRLAIASKGKGKSGGARVITFIKIVDWKGYLVTIYDKGQLDNLTKEQIFDLLKKAGLV